MIAYDYLGSSTSITSSIVPFIWSPHSRRPFFYSRSLYTLSFSRSTCSFSQANFCGGGCRIHALSTEERAGRRRREHLRADGKRYLSVRTRRAPLIALSLFSLSLGRDTFNCTAILQLCYLSPEKRYEDKNTHFSEAAGKDANSTGN